MVEVTEGWTMKAKPFMAATVKIYFIVSGLTVRKSEVMF